MRNLLIVMLALCAGIAEAQAPGRRRAARKPDLDVPRCGVIAGFPLVGVSTDGGRSVIPHADEVSGIQTYTFGVAALDTEHVVATTGRVLFRSSDRGCTWEVDSAITFPQTDYRFVTAGGKFWAWSRNSADAFFFDGTITSRRLPTDFPISFFADRADPARIATADDQGNIWWSDDSGTTWVRKPVAPARPPLYAVEFSPADRAHVLASGLADGGHVTLDGGTTWSAVSGLEGMNVFTVVSSPVDSNVIWAMALRPTLEGPRQRAIYRSQDGGQSFARVLEGSAEVQMPNGFVLAPHPTDPSLLYFPLAGTDLFLIDSAGVIRQRARLPYRDINAIIFSPAQPRVMYFGLKISDMSF